MGGLVARKTDTCTTGHSCDTTTKLSNGQSTVFAENQLVARIGDPTVSHDVPTPVPDGMGGTTIVCLPHTGSVRSGNSTVYAVNKLVTFIGETVSCNNGKITSSASTVYVEG
jgi:uncharacterized Zn-binding protein involved in type VI secretion